MRSKQDLKGMKFNKLLVLREVEEKTRSNGKKIRMWECLCDCGKKTILYHGSIKHGGTKSCGCEKEIFMNRNGKYKKHDGIRQLAVIKYRCYNENSEYYHVYGGRGIKVCDEWLKDTISFCKWCDEVGWSKESDLTIDRIDVDGDYNPSNCRLATKSQQSFNVRHSSKRDFKNVGVYWCKTKMKWGSRISVEGERIKGEFFEKKEDAIKNRKELEIKYYGQLKNREG